jgi:branched-chain amino acid transport system substrate-binding protein
MIRRTRSRALVVVVAGLALVAAACGSDDKSSSSTQAATTTAAAAATTAGGAATTAGGAATTAGGAATTAGGAATTAAAGSTPAGSAGCPAIDASLDAKSGNGAGEFMSSLECADKAPLKAVGDPIVIGFQNPEGDPNGSFPEATLGAEAAVKYINEELGGWGSDIQNGKPGRPIKLEVCKTAISPDDSQRCANEIVAKKPELAVSTINFFGNHLPIFEAAGIPAIVTSPVTIADFTSKSAYAIAGGGGCLGAHTALVEYAAVDLGAKRVAVPWADTPPGVVCYYDLEKKPLDVLQGAVKGTSDKAGTIPDLQNIGVPIKPATPDITPQVTQILDFKPNAIIFSAQGSDCWNLVDGLGRLGWTPDKIPLVMSGSCIDFDAMKAAGDLAKGVFFITTGNSVTNDPTAIADPLAKFEATIFQTKPIEYGMDKSALFKGFGSNGFNSLVNIWELSTRADGAGDQPTGKEFASYVKATDGDHMFGSTPLSCSTAPPPYVAVCNSVVSIAKWDGTSLVPVKPNFSAADLIAGTELKPGP